MKKKMGLNLKERKVQNFRKKKIIMAFLVTLENV